MPNHFQLVVRPAVDGVLSHFMRWLTMTHTQRWHAHHHSAGTGHLYQGRFKSFPVQDDGHLVTLCRYVERNALRPGLVRRAEDWRWGSLVRHVGGGVSCGSRLSRRPIERPEPWAARVNEPIGPAEEALRRSVARGQPFGSDGWREETATRLGLGSTLRLRGWPRKTPSISP